MFENDAGIDVVRAMHLDLSGRAIPAGRGGWRALHRRAMGCGKPDSATAANPRDGRAGTGRPRMAWLAADDLTPVRAAVANQATVTVRLEALRISG